MPESRPEQLLDVPETIEITDDQPQRVSRLGRAMTVLSLVAAVGTGAYALDVGGEARPATNQLESAEHVAPESQPANITSNISFSRPRILAMRAQDAKLHNFFELLAAKQAEAKRQAKRIPYDAPRWYRLHNCEQPDTWHAGGHFGNGLESGGNGLGMSMDAWRMAVRDAADRGVVLPPTGWTATIDQQMQAAQVFWEDEGWGWACPR